MPVLLVVGGGLFGSQAATYARKRGIESLVFDPGQPGGASPAAAGLFKEAWAGKKGGEHFRRAVGVLEMLYGIRHVPLTYDDGAVETFLCVPPTAILEKTPIRQAVTAVGDGWLETADRHHEGWVYIAAGVWSSQFHSGLEIVGKAGSSFLFECERHGRIQPLARGRQAIAFTRDPGSTFFSDGTAEINYSDEHERKTLERAAALGLTTTPMARLHGLRPYTPGGPVFMKLGSRTWLATGGRKMGTIMGASFAKRLIDDEIG